LPAGSRQLIPPPAALFEIAPAKVLHGAVRLHGLASSPTPDTHVRVAWACAIVAHNSRAREATNSCKERLMVFIVSLLVSGKLVIWGMHLHVCSSSKLIDDIEAG